MCSAAAMPAPQINFAKQRRSKLTIFPDEQKIVPMFYAQWQKPWCFSHFQVARCRGPRSQKSLPRV